MIKIQKFNPFKTTARGISLVELLIVMGIITLVTAITIPTVNSYLPSWKLSSSARAVSIKLRQAQEEAVTTQIRHGIKFNPTANPPTIEFIKTEPTQTILETVALGTGITLATDSIISNTINQNKIIFSPDSGPSCSGTITVTLGSAVKTITVSPAGVIKLQ